MKLLPGSHFLRIENLLGKLLFGTAIFCVNWGLYVSKFTKHDDLNPGFMNNIFKLKIHGREVRDEYKLNLDIPRWNQRTFGYKSLKV